MYAAAGSRAVYLRRRRAARKRLVWQWSLVAVVALVGGALLLGLAFAGSSEKLPAGATIAGMSVGGYSTEEAIARLERRYESLRDVPVAFTAGPRRWRIRPNELILEVDWAAAVETARRQGDGFAPVRGLRRLETRFFGADVMPRARVYEAVLAHKLDVIAGRIDRPQREAAIRLRGLNPELVRGATGRSLDRTGAGRVIVSSLLTLNRTAPAALPVRISQPELTAAELAPVMRQVRTAVSGPVRLALGPARWRLPRWRVALLLELPSDGAKKLAIGGPSADAFFRRFRRQVDRKPVDAGFTVAGDKAFVTPSKPGRRLDVAAAKRAILAAALAPVDRVARLLVQRAPPDRTTREARAMGIKASVGGYTTYYGGEPNRIHNVQLVSRLIDGAMIPPGKTFSFNGTTGERSADKGFLEAPVIINGELQTGLGGGVCQVSTTVFNAAFEAGLPIDSRTNHALYISHYPQGRDATVNYPDIDLKFRNNTGRWLLLRTFVGSSALTVKLYGTPTGRRVESETGPLEVTGPPRVKRVPDPGLWVGEQVTDEVGQPSRRTSVVRRVYSRGGKQLSETTWTSWYRSEPTVVRYGTKPKPAPAKPKKKKPPPPPPPPPAEPTPPPPPPLP